MNQLQKQTELSRLEGVIRQSGLVACDALAQIHEQELFKLGFDNFEDYCKTRWNFSKSTGYRMVDASRTAKSLPPHFSHLCDKLTVADALGRVSPENRLAVAEAVIVGGEASVTAVQEAAAATCVLELGASEAAFQTIAGLHSVLSQPSVTDWAKERLNLIRELGLHLQGIAGRKNIDRGHYLKMKGKLPENFSYDDIKACVRIANKHKEPITDDQAVAVEVDAIMRLSTGIASESQRGEQKLKTMPVTEVLAAIFAVQSKVKKEFVGLDECGRDQVVGELHRLRDWLNTFLGSA